MNASRPAAQAALQAMRQRRDTASRPQPLAMAAWEGRLEIVAVLLEAGASQRLDPYQHGALAAAAWPIVLGPIPPSI